MTDPFTEREVRLGDAFDELDAHLDELAAMLQDADSETASAQALLRRANETEARLSGVAWLIEEYGEDATVTVTGLGAGDFARVEDRVATIRAQSDEPGGVPGSKRNVVAAAGLVDAPFLDLDEDASERQQFKQKLGAVGSDQLPVGVTKWLEHLVNEESSIEGNWTPLSERLAASSED
ncbi:hypothetical protein BRC81_02960 [Halobacteriales archaeon QS_1_68_20]|nr:MAG: hypothetical protein BRC81_02960 [Halobacteriales archaeon QS_1_68_20]